MKKTTNVASFYKYKRVKKKNKLSFVNMQI